MFGEALKNKSCKGNLGFTLVESLVSIFILGLISLGLAASMNLANSQIKNVQAKSTKMDLASSMRFHTSDFMSLYNSAQMPENTSLKSCLEGVSDTACTNNQDVEFNYYGSIRDVPVYDASGNLVSMKAPVVGGVSSLTCPAITTSPSPVFYSAEGLPCSCTDSAAKCPMQLVTKYAAFCSVGVTCKYASGFRVSYQVKLRSDIPESQNMVIANLNGNFFVPVADNTNYLKFIYAGSYFVDPLGFEFLKFSTGDYDIRKGAVIQYISPSIVRMKVAFSSPVLVKTAELYKYTYPVGCSSLNLGTILADGTNCVPPLEDKYIFDKTISSNEVNSGVVSAEVTIGSNLVIEYKVKTFDGAHAMVAVTRSPLRVAYSLEGNLSVQPPTNGLFFICDTTNTTTNAFTFTASETISGWKSFSATISPALPDGTTVLPGFSTQFNPSLTTAQKVNVDMTGFPITGGNYTVVFEGVTNTNETKRVTANFKVNPAPANTAVITSPTSGVNVRATSDLNFTANVKLGCNQTVQSANFSLIQGGTALFPVKDIANTCTKDIAGPVDQVSYTCNMVYPCESWLGVTDPSLCPGKFPSVTSVTAKFDVKNNLSQALSASPVSFTVSPKVSIWLARGYTQFLNINYAGNITIVPPAQTKIRVSLSSSLLTNESISFTYGGTNFTCKQSGGGSATYGDYGAGWIYETIKTNNGTSTTSLGYGCVFSVNTPATATPSAPATYQLSSSSPTVEVLSPNITRFKAVDPANFSCTAPDSGAPVCPVGTSIKTMLTQAGAPYDNSSWQTLKSSVGLALVDPVNSTLDFFIYYRPTSATNIPMPSFALNFDIAGSTDQIVTTSFFDTPVSMCSQASPLSCEGDLTRVLPDYFNSKRTYYTSGATASAFPTFPGSANVYYQFMIARQCYCQ